MCIRDSFWTVREALENYDPLVLRHALLNAHYRSPIDLTEQLLEDAKGHHAKLIEAYGHALVIIEQAKKAGMQEAPRLPQADVASPDFLTSKLGLLEKLLQEAAIAMDDDFNSPLLIAQLFEAVKFINLIIHEDHPIKYNQWKILNKMLPVFIHEVLGIGVEKESSSLAEEKLKQTVGLLIELRNKARINKDFETSDQIYELCLLKNYYP